MGPLLKAGNSFDKIPLIACDKVYNSAKNLFFGGNCSSFHNARPSGTALAENLASDCSILSLFSCNIVSA